MLRRHEIVARIVELTGSSDDPEKMIPIWFWDIRRTGGLRLTKTGFEALKKANIQNWSVPLDPRHLTKRVILDMNRKLTWPYYISTHPPQLILFSDRDAVLASLYGDLSSWLGNL